MILRGLRGKLLWSGPNSIHSLDDHHVRLHIMLIVVQFIVYKDEHVQVYSITGHLKFTVGNTLTSDLYHVDC